VPAIREPPAHPGKQLPVQARRRLQGTRPRLRNNVAQRQGKGSGAGDKLGGKHASLHFDSVSSRRECSLERFAAAHLQRENLPTEFDQDLVRFCLRAAGWPT
jgi:hypothetical protein